MILTLNKIHVSREGAEVIHGVSLRIASGEVHALMGPNGSGKSSLANAVMGHPKYQLTSGEISLNNENITALSPHEKAKRGLFLALQNPPEIGGVSVMNFLRAALNAVRSEPINVIAFHALLKKTLQEMNIESTLANRPLNEGFSGGEKKRIEMLQLRLLAPSFAILDETDAGLDVDAMQIMTSTVSALRSQGTGFLIISHYPKIFDLLIPDKVSILHQGDVVATGGPTLIKKIERDGYGSEK